MWCLERWEKIAWCLEGKGYARERWENKCGIQDAAMSVVSAS
jgi:hypothetical protein